MNVLITEPAEEDGGSQSYTDPDAPKAVTDTCITSFSCGFSTLAMAEDILGNQNYKLEAELSHDEVTGRYHSYDRFGGRCNRILQAAPSFMKRLQAIAAKYSFASYNSGHTRCYGISPEYGSYIRVIYASGEEVCASDDQGCFLPIGAIIELETLFRKHSKEEM